MPIHTYAHSMILNFLESCSQVVTFSGNVINFVHYGLVKSILYNHLMLLQLHINNWVSAGIIKLIATITLWIYRSTFLFQVLRIILGITQCFMTVDTIFS